jgi:hypothetical protein
MCPSFERRRRFRLALFQVAGLLVAQRLDRVECRGPHRWIDPGGEADGERDADREGDRERRYHRGPADRERDDLGDGEAIVWLGAGKLSQLLDTI